ncbi:DUF2637 domain-containing protein [Micromonospora sp. WMMD1274]|uniref:DUF2637 domain-containing protein n=1 Tax=Micromonospora sp. WMMD1274 TaxID=3404116 RepID=UPI003B922E48
MAASVAANVLHARPNPISQIIAAWPPLALLLTVELISRVPHHRRLLGAIRIAATAVIAAIATWVSYWHLAGVAARYGETEHGAAHLLPISVDGLVIVASVSLVEITAKIRTAARPPVASALTPSSPMNAPAAAVSISPALTGGATAGTTTGAPTSVEQAAQADQDLIDRSTSASTTSSHGDPSAEESAADGTGVPPSTHRHHPHHDNHPHEADAPTATPRPAPYLKADNGDLSDYASAQASPPPPGTSHAEAAGTADDERTDDVPADTAAAVAYWRRRDPDLLPADIAARIGRSERTVYRYWSPPAADGTVNLNGRPADSNSH